MATIGLLAYKIVADTSGFSEGVTATRAELRAAKAITEQTMTANERLEESLKGLEHLYTIGAIDANTYARAVDRVQDESREAAAATHKLSAATASAATSQDAMFASQIAGLPILGGMNASLLAMHPAALAATAALAAMAVGIGSVYVGARALVNTVAESTQAILELDQAAQQLGVSSTALAGFRDAASDIGGVKEGQFDAAIQQMNVRLAKAAAGTGKATWELLGQYNLDPLKLGAMGTEEAFLTLADVVGKIPNQMERARFATQMFGKSGVELLNVFEAGSGAIRESVANAQEIGLALSPNQTAQVVAMSHAFNDLADMSEGFGNQLTAAVAPAVAALGLSFGEALQTGTPVRELLDSTVTVVGSLANNLGMFADVGAIAFGAVAMGAGVLLQEVQFVVRALALMDEGLAAIGVGEVNKDFQQLATDLQAFANTTFQSGAKLMAQGFDGQFQQAFDKAKAKVEATSARKNRFSGSELAGLLDGMDAYEKKKRTSKPKTPKTPKPKKPRTLKASARRRSQVGAVTRGTVAAFSASKSAVDAWRERQERVAENQLNELKNLGLAVRDLGRVLGEKFNVTTFAEVTFQ